MSIPRRLVYVLIGGALNCLVEELDNQRRNIDDLYSGPDTKEVMTDQAFRAAIKEWEIVRDRADAILNPKINRNSSHRQGWAQYQ